ncbi:hypothetical protein [Microbispora sp. NBRC 16548]|uniref:hypothetical protein n=1 Tax=Microbispora sp. NBRC 16548 TaxID=3030994 RepID=UPI002553FB41|nr:hypothetical protein [Microbispora sp. NBRC 16548]
MTSASAGPPRHPPSTDHSSRARMFLAWPTSPPPSGYEPTVITGSIGGIVGA